MKKLGLILLTVLFSATAVFADVTVKGTVTSAEDNEPLPGVSIVVKGTTTGTVTDFDGNYQISVPDGAVLQFSFIGFKTVEETAKAQINVAMATDAFVMDEVVSLGYSATKKAELSSAVVTLSADALTDVTTADVGNMLQGKVAGVQISNSTGQPGAAAEIKIRGTGSITASSDPVYVVDGVMGGSFNPNDVETISVLKDAGATGIYGAAAAGGVIVVTTKKGSNNQKPRVNVRATVGMDQPIFGNFQLMDSEELYYYHKSMYPKSIFGTLRPKDLLNRNYNWQDCFFKTGVTQDYYASLSGGTSKLGYYASFDYYKQDGTLINTGYEKYSGRVNMNAEITKWFDMNVRVNFDKSKTDESASWRILNDAYTKMPWDNPYDVNTGEPVYISSATRTDDGTAWYSQDKWNALHNAQYDYARSDAFSFGADIQLNFHITDWLHFTSTNRYSYGSGQYETYTDPRSYGTDKGNLYNGASFSNSFGTTNILKASYQWGQHSVNGMLGFEYGIWNSKELTATGIGMPNGVDALNACAAETVGGYVVPGASWAAFAQAGYDYAKRYFVTATFRAEASSIFAPENRVGYFPSVAASWLISNEEFMKNQKTVSFLKLRASYGVTGNNSIPSYLYLSTYGLNSLYQNNTSATPSRLSNPLLHWETANMAALGIDIAFIDRVDMSIDLYNTDNTGLLLNVPVAPSTGFFEVMQNAGSVRNQGIEYRIDANIIKMKDWRWDLGFNIGFNKNRVTYTPDHTPFFQTANSVNQQVKEGQDIYSWYMKEWAGVDTETGDPLWYVIDEDGNKTTTNNYNEATEHVVGKATPLFQGGLNTVVSWKGLSLSINTNFTYGNKIYNYNRMAEDADGAYLGYNQMSINNSKLGWSRWEEPGDVATHPKAVLNGNKNSNQISSRYLEDGSFLRLKNVTLSYDFATLIPKGVNKLRLYVSADNLATASKFSGMDPEVSIYSDTYRLAGMYSDQYPVCRTFLVGVEMEF